MAAKDTYTEGIGRRKSSTARVRIIESQRSDFLVNDLKLNEYFKTENQIKVAKEALDVIKSKFKVTVKVSGGGLSSQAEAVRHGVARALEKFDSALRAELKDKGFLKRDPRKKERKKFGLKKARRAPQWSKR